MTLKTEEELRREFSKNIHTFLGGNFVDIEIGEEEIQICINKAVSRYRTRSSNAYEESFMFLQTQPDIQIYKLPDEVKTIYKIYRRGTGTASTGGIFDPFGLAFTQNLYLISQNTGGAGAGSLAMYDMAVQYQELVGRLFGNELNFKYNDVTKMLWIERRIGASEQLLLNVYNTKPIISLLTQDESSTWLFEYTIACAKMMMGEARSLFSSVPAGGGQVTLNGSELKQEALAEFERLENELKNSSEQDIAYGHIIIG